eukprot:GGOE01044292.1.p1 GENE.GGOE01044292.1~~GGOE01044292.1.p1  ORF type:complete len:669 (-),score=173.44 GGOE01044292.1:535-2502(-)
MATQNYVDKLILEASARFEEKFHAAKDGQTANVSYGGSDRTYNLRTQIQHIPQLQLDKHFMVMVNDIDKYTSPEWTLRGDIEKRLYSLLAGLLKGLLRESISGDAAVRKINVEKCWNWYRDEKKLLLEWKMDKRQTGSTVREDGRISPTKGEDAEGGSTARIDVADDAEASLRRTQVRGVPGSPTAAAEKKVSVLQKVKDRIEGSALDLNYMKQEEEQQRATDIVKKLQLYQKRNLQKSLEQRLGQTTVTAAESVGRPLTASTVSQGQDSSVPRIVYRDPRKSDPPRTAPILMHSMESPDLPQHVQQQANPLQLKSSKEFIDALANVQKVWVQKRAQEAEAKLDEMEFADTVAMWSHNQARIEEEINRRQEAYQMSSQTGRTCHHILCRPHTAARSDPQPLDLNCTAPPRLGVVIDSSRSQYPGTGKVISLSPYDNFDPDRDGRKMRLLTSAQQAKVCTPDDDNLEGMRLKGLRHTHPSGIRGTSLMNGKLDVLSTFGTTFAPSMRAAIGKIPTTADADAEEEAAPNAGSKKQSPKAEKAGKDGKGKKAAKKRGPVDPGLMEQIFPVLTVEQEVPSVLRMKQMQQVENIREAFAKYGMSVPTSTIEHGILTPEDRPYIECMTNLPPPESGFVSDFTRKRDKPKGKPAKAKAPKAA